MDKYAFFSVPNDNGWGAKVNGKTVEILNINGMMAISIKKDKKIIEFV